MLIVMTYMMVTKLVAVVVISPIFLIPSVAIAAAGGWCGNIYMKGQLAIKREKSNARAPVLANFGAAIAGLSKFASFVRHMHAHCIISLHSSLRCARLL